MSLLVDRVLWLNGRGRGASDAPPASRRAPTPPPAPMAEEAEAEEIPF